MIRIYPRPKSLRFAAIPGAPAPKELSFNGNAGFELSMVSDGVIFRT
jgi:hypothetical protein